MAHTILDAILEEKRRHVAERQRVCPIEVLVDSTLYDAPRRGFVRALQASPDRVALIAEVKRASPSRGVICEYFDPIGIAKSYEQGGATCISVLTDVPYFQGDDEHLKMARDAVMLPVLRKDFIIHEYQLHESKALGADCILLIVAAFEDRVELTDLYQRAVELGLDALVEVHDERQMEIALGLAPVLIGINNRNLKTFETDIATTERLAPLAPKNSLVISESAIRAHDDVCRVADAGARAILVGEGLVDQPDIVAAIRRLMGQ